MRTALRPIPTGCQVIIADGLKGSDDIESRSGAEST